MSPGHAFISFDIFLEFSLITAKSIAVINYVEYLDAIDIFCYLLFTKFDQETLKPVFCPLDMLL